MILDARRQGHPSPDADAARVLLLPRLPSAQDGRCQLAPSGPRHEVHPPRRRRHLPAPGCGWHRAVTRLLAGRPAVWGTHPTTLGTPTPLHHRTKTPHTDGTRHSRGGVFALRRHAEPGGGAQLTVRAHSTYGLRLADSGLGAETLTDAAMTGERPKTVAADKQLARWRDVAAASSSSSSDQRRGEAVAPICGFIAGLLATSLLDRASIALAQHNLLTGSLPRRPDLRDCRSGGAPPPPSRALEGRPHRAKNAEMNTFLDT